MWQHWLASYPELKLLDLDVGRGQSELRTVARLSLTTKLLLPYDERILLHCLRLLAYGDAEGGGALAIAESRKGSMLADIHLLAGAALLGNARFDDAAGALAQCYGPGRNPGEAIQRLCPSLRFELRLSPCLLVPLYPNQFSAALLLAVAQWHAGHSGEALETIKEMVSEWGLYDEVKLLAGQIHLERGELDKAQHALVAGEDTQRDALELARNFYLAYVHFQKSEYRTAARALMPSLTLARQINPHLHARTRLLAAECFDRCDLPLEALRQSAHVLPEEVPGDVAAEMLKREEHWMVALEHLSKDEIERMSRTDSYHIYVPEQSGGKNRADPLSRSRNPLKNMRVTERSWRKIQEQEREIAEKRAAVAMGRTPARPEEPLSGEATEFRLRVARAQGWWPGRRAALEKAGSHAALARSAGETGHVRYDFQGMQARSTLKLMGEKRAALVGTIAGASLLIALCLFVIRTCIYWK